MTNLLTAISTANNSLLREKEIGDALQFSINALGLNTSVDRCYLFQNNLDNGILKLYYMNEWCNVGVTPYIGSPDLNGHSYDSFPGLYEPLNSNVPLYGLVKESSDPNFKEIMEMQDIKAFLFTPVFSNNEFWGWIGFDDCTTERLWKLEEVQALHSVANNIGLRLEQESSNRNSINALNQLDTYIKGSKLAKWEWDLITNEVHFSYNWFGMLGYRDNELDQSYSTWITTLYSDDVTDVEKKIQDFLSGKTNQCEGAVRMNHKNGSIVWTKYSSFAIYNSQNKPIKLIFTHIDITNLKIKELQLKISEDKFRFIAENTTDLICQHDQYGLFTYVSKSSLDIIGYLPQELIGKDPFQFYHIEEEANMRKILEDLLTNNKSEPIAYRFRKKNGQYCWLETTSKLIRDNHGKIITIQTSSRDISDRLHAKQEIEHALNKERELNELKSGFVTMASHQFRTPLTVIYSNIELLNYKIVAVDKKIKKDITVISNRIMNEIDRMTELMNNILIFGKYESRNLKVEINQFCLDNFIEKMIETYFSHEKDNRKIIFEINGESQYINSDESLLNHILNNLISNAFKYSQTSPNPIVKLYYFEEYYIIEVIDFGIGIPEIEKKHLFQSFFRASNTATIKGSGLGLVIAKQFTELLKGSIKIESFEEQGTTVTLKFPYENKDIIS